MKSLARALPVIFLTLTLAQGEEPGFDCSENLLPEAAVQHIFHLRDELAKDERFIRSLQDTHQALIEFYRVTDPSAIERVKGVMSVEDVQAMTERLVSVLQSRLLAEATAKTFRHYRVKRTSALKKVLSELHQASISDRLRFAEGVVFKTDHLFEEGLRLLDQDRGAEVIARWGVTPEGLLDLLQKWEVMRNIGGFEIKLLMLRYLELAEMDEIIALIRDLKKDASDLVPMTDEERLLALRLHHPFTNEDLAKNMGPISDREFTRKLLFLNVSARLSRIGGSVRRPNITFAMVALSFIPPGLSYYITKDMDGLTNILATLMGGVGTSNLLLKVFEPVPRTPKTFWWVNALSLSQLNQLDAFIASNPHQAENLTLDLVHSSVLDRIQELRKLRYSSSSITR